jgi:hypothetical protein
MCPQGVDMPSIATPLFVSGLEFVPALPPVAAPPSLDAAGLSESSGWIRPATRSVVRSSLVVVALIIGLLGLALTGAILTSRPTMAFATTSALKCQGPGAPTEQQLIGCQDYTITGRPYAPTNSGTAQWNNLFQTFGAIFGLAAPTSAADGEILSRLSASGRELDPTDAGGKLTRAGRAYAKASEVFGPTSGGPASINQAGQSALKAILYNDNTVLRPMNAGNFVGGSKFVSPNGIGAVFSTNGTLQYFARFGE